MIMKKSPARSQIQNNTLLNYFSRTPKTNNDSINDANDKNFVSENVVTPSKRKTDSLSPENDNEEEIINSKKRNKKFKRIYFNDEDEEEDQNDDKKSQSSNEASDEEYCPSDDNDDMKDDEDLLDFFEELSNEEEEFKVSKSKNKKKRKNNSDDDFIDDDDDFEDELYKDDDESDVKLSKLKSIRMNEDNDEEQFQNIKIDPSIYANENDENDHLLYDENPPTEYSILNKKCKDKSANSSMRNVEKPTRSENTDKTQWPHLTFKFLQPENIRDLNNNKMLIDGELNPNYDPSTLYVPGSFLDEQTPALRQWWEIKSQHFDTILFFKMGKFYEFFHMDAVICTKELKILFMRGDNAHAGFPEKSYKQYADALIQKGYKVARIEQTETPEMMTERCKKMKKLNKFDKVVKREICRISTIGTRFMSNIDSDTFLSFTSYLMAFTCKPIQSSLFEIGVSFVDVSLGKFYLTQFIDDRFNSKLRTLISHYSPVEIIIESTNKLSKLIQAICPTVRLQQVRSFWSTSETLKYIYKKELWSKVSEDFKNAILDPTDVIQQKSFPEFELAVIAIGAIFEHLEKSMIIDDIMSMRQFEIYRPPEFDAGSNKLPNYMILDSMTIKNLEIFESLNNRYNSMTLFSIIDNCSTAFGKRMLRSWVCQPLCGLRDELELRRDAVRDLAENEKIAPHLNRWSTMMKKLPDLERLLTQIHSDSLKKSQDHPDSRAILFESELYRLRKIKTFLFTLSGIESLLEIIQNIASNSNDINSQYLIRLVNHKNDDKLSFPVIEDKIKFFRQSFDAEKVLNEGQFTPRKGADEEFDQIINRIDQLEKKFVDYLNEQKLFFKEKITYVHCNKNRYQLEMPDILESKLKKSSESFVVKSRRKGYIRCYTSTLVEMVDDLEQAENERDMIQSDIFRRFLAKFDQDFNKWQQAIACLAQFDALMSLANTRNIFESNGSVSCLPEFLWDQNLPVIRAKDLRNAFLVINNEVIPNDIELNGETLILTGPNMGGKTTLMRSVALIGILAHIGAYVPASECFMTPIDRIFTRIGSYDLIMENESTFMVELSEALSIIKYATSFSLALIDELGSGTSTFDGTAIASAIITDLTEKIKCRIIFSTHYHSIMDELKNKSNIKLGFMSYIIENENDIDPTDENIIFLYKLQYGVCNKSYGFNVAKLAGIPTSVIREGYKYSKRFHLECQIKALLNWFNVRKKLNYEIKTDFEAQEKALELYSAMKKLQIIDENNP